MLRKRILAALIAAIFVVPAVPTLAQTKRTSTPKTRAQGVLPPIKYTQFFLPNGMRVILHEDHSTPIVGVNVWYHVGSKNEEKGRTGFAHLFEHMMFQGFRGYDYDYIPVIQEIGGAINGSTTEDRTNYWEVVPSNFLETALFMEAGRLGGLLDAMTQTKLDNQRDVVKNEKRQRIDNQPYGQAIYKIPETMYPVGHPYHWSPIGSMEDLSAASLEDVKSFFRRYYVPNNASLVISGDFNPVEAKKLAEKYFAKLPKGETVTRPTVAPPTLAKEIREEIEDRVQLPRVYMTWHSMPQYSKDEASLDLVASVLAGGKSSRLFKTLVYDKQIAQDVAAFNSTNEIGGLFQLVATAKPGKTLAEIEKVINDEIARLQKEGPTAEEMTRVYNAREANFIYGLQTVGGFGGKDDKLNGYATFLNNPGFFEEDLARYRKTTAADVQKAANQYLTDKRYILSVVPRARTAGGDRSGSAQQSGARRQAPAAAPAAPVAKEQKKTGDLALLPKPKPDPSFSLPPVQRRKLSNGLEVLVVEHHELPIVNMNLVINTGGAADPSGKAGLASLTADMLDEGTATRSALDLSNQLASIGSSVSVFAGWDSTTASLRTLTKHMDNALNLYADVILNPAFPANELDRLRTSRLVSFRQRRDNPQSIASIVYQQVLYGRTHPYGNPLTGNEESVGGLKGEDVKTFYETYYRPNNAKLIVVGDVKADDVAAKLEKALGKWQGADVPVVNLSDGAVTRDKSQIYIVDRPGSVQSIVMIGQVGVPRTSPDYFPLLVMNRILGGASSARINLNLREDKGYTYGASSGFDFRRGAGPFTASAPVQGFSTKESVVEFLRELRGIRGDIPVRPDELEGAKQSIIRGFPRTFETPAQIADRLETVATYGLTDDYFNSYIANVQRVTLDDVKRVANRYLTPDKMAIVVVGDRQSIEQSLRSLEQIGDTLTFVDLDGKPVPSASSTSGGDNP